MTRQLLLTSMGMAFFIVCPRMAAIVHTVAQHSHLSLDVGALLGALLATPLMLLMVVVLDHAGVAGALAFCVATDLLSALLLRELSLRAGLETAIIALFVLLGVKLAPRLCALLPG
jgi:hypothetical protein